ncbi:CamS family sex pheromone protein [Bacillus sp. HMF5848]|uniref:CamS family sex pheromone protein n=1 Tax=Bacillus sp. HMF5848 TaxID=2495421 RepID=UPI000F79EEA9|nr:CamS family sex pheromone protein [Bacillus sp. HMF5848]RSK25772.1 CamS family sex pheromone protein [Bacillus sp. HMF5848]
MRYILTVFTCCLVLLAACAPNFKQEEELIQETTEQTTERAIIPKYNISNSYYQTILPFQPSAARGLVTNLMRTRYDIDEFETGLIRVAQDKFPTDEYLFQEGQFLDEKTIYSWISRKKTADEVAESQSPNLGLNPALSEEERLSLQANEESPQYLSYILEHNYYKKTDDGKIELEAIVLGLALNSVHYFNAEYPEGIFPREYEIPDEDIEREGEKMAQQVLQRVRQIEGLEEVPIVIALFKQEAASSITPGNFFAKTYVNGKNNSVGKWEPIFEDYILFPSSEAMDTYREDAILFNNFKDDIAEFFPNFTGIIGTGFYASQELQHLEIDINMQFYGKAEVIGFTQYVTGIMLEQFPPYISVEIHISSISGPESLIVREVNEKDPLVHIYN